jgi:hypothetical protein
MRLVLWFAMFVVLGGCAQNRQYFRPTERVRGQTLQGYHEAFYELLGPSGRFCEAKVWSIGAYRRGDDSVLEVSLEVHNTSAQPIEISAKDLRLWRVRTSSQVFKELPPAETGVFRIKSEAQAGVKVHFILPAGVSPGEVTSFGFAWKVRNAEQSYALATPFREEAAYYPPSVCGYGYCSSFYSCSPYDLHCIGYGYYDYWPYGHYYPAPPSGFYPVHEERRRVEVNR